MRRKSALVLGGLAVLLGAAAVFHRPLLRRYVDRRIERTLDAPLPAFELRTTAGAELTPAALRGKVAILHFSRSRCGSCEREKPALLAFSRALDRDGARLVTILTDPVQGYPPDETAATLARWSLPHETALATADAMAAFHGPTFSNVTPIWYFADAEGQVVATLRGAQTEAALEAALAKAR